MKQLFFVFLSFVHFVNANEISQTTISYFEMPDFKVYHQSAKEVNELTQQVIVLDHFSTDGNKSMHDWVESAKGKNVLLIFPILEMKHLQFLNSKQQDSHSHNFVNQLNKIFNKKYSLKNNLYRIYSNKQFADLINRYMLQFIDNDLEKFVIKNPTNQVFNIELMNQASEGVIKNYLRTKGSYVSSAMAADATSDFLQLVNFAENKSLAFRWRYQNLTSSRDQSVQEFIFEDL